MAKQKSVSGDSNFDISRWLDLDDERKVKVDSSESYGLDFTPLTKEEITTANLDVNLTVSIDSYIASGRVPRAEKKKLYVLANVNAHAEDEVKNLEAFIVSNSGSYHSIVAGILKGNSDLERTTLDDDDPYSAEPVSIDDTSSNAKANVTKADALFGEIHDLEGKRAMLNRQRKAKLEEMLEVASKRNLSGYAPLIAVVTDKISGIDNVQDVTRAKITLEDERNFEKDAKEFQKYISGGFDPLADDDEDDGPLGEYVRNVDNFTVEMTLEELETPLEQVEFTDEELRTIDKSSEDANLESFVELLVMEDKSLTVQADSNSESTGEVPASAIDWSEIIDLGSVMPKPSRLAELYSAGKSSLVNESFATENIRALWDDLEVDEFPASFTAESDLSADNLEYDDIDVADVELAETGVESFLEGNGSESVTTDGSNVATLLRVGQITPESILGLREYDEASAIYKSSMKQLLRVVFSMMDQADRSKASNVSWFEEVDVYQLSSAIADDNLKALLEACRNEPIFDEAEDLIENIAHNKRSVNAHSLEELRAIADSATFRIQSAPIFEELAEEYGIDLNFTNNS